jgi:prepilin-type N-terminal cleavage/methylation domain-containing protein
MTVFPDQPRKRFVAPARSCARHGFTLIETAMAMVIVGVAIVASMRLFAACSIQNRASTQMTTAMLLAGNVREAMIGLSFSDPTTGRATFGSEAGETLATYNDLDDFNGPANSVSQSFNPPIDSLRGRVTSLSQFTQVVSVMPVWPYKLSGNTSESAPEISPRSTYTGAVRVRVRVLYRMRPTDTPVEVYRCSWVRVDN